MILLSFLENVFINVVNNKNKKQKEKTFSMLCLRQAHSLILSLSRTHYSNAEHKVSEPLYRNILDFKRSNLSQPPHFWIKRP
jgi:hypothetical protein